MEQSIAGHSSAVWIVVGHFWRLEPMTEQERMIRLGGDDLLAIKTAIAHAGQYFEPTRLTYELGGMTFEDLELAPSKHWTPKCFGEYHTAFSDCRDCVWQKKCEEFEEYHSKNERSIVPPPSDPPDVPPTMVRKM
jgi:hypothetical protein